MHLQNKHLYLPSRIILHSYMISAPEGVTEIILELWLFWSSGVRSAMRAASQLPGRGPTVVDMAPIPVRLSKSDDDDDDAN